MNLAVFDLDHTLLAGDSDYLWGQFLIEQGLVDAEAYALANRRFYEEYRNGALDIEAFAAFSFAPLARYGLERLEPLRARFVTEKIEPILAPQAPALLERHRAEGARLLITTATNRFVTEPIAQHLGVSDLIATEIEIVAGRCTGRIRGTPNFREGKLARLREWLARQPQRYTHLTVYSDSHNDLPLLEAAHAPVAVDPDPVLRETAQERGWPIISLREIEQDS